MLTSSIDKEKNIIVKFVVLNTNILVHSIAICGRSTDFIVCSVIGLCNVLLIIITSSITKTKYDKAYKSYLNSLAYVKQC